MSHGQYRFWVLLASLVFPFAAAACRCDLYSSSFVEIASRAHTIVQATVDSHGDARPDYPGYEGPPRFESMNLRVSRVFKGGSVSKTLKVWGDNGAQCRPYVTYFPQNTEWVFVLREASKDRFNMPPSGDTSGEYWLGICGANWLLVDADKIRGRILDRKLEQVLTSAELRDALAPNPALDRTR